MFRIISILLLFLLFFGCDKIPLFSDSGDPIALYLDMETPEVENVHEIEASLIVTNISVNEVTFSFPSGCQHGFTIKKEETILVNSNDHIFCTTALTELRLKPGENRSFPINLAFLSDSINLESGTYMLNTFLLEGHSGNVSKPFHLN